MRWVLLHRIRLCWKIQCRGNQCRGGQRGRLLRWLVGRYGAVRISRGHLRLCRCLSRWQRLGVWLLIRLLINDILGASQLPFIISGTAAHDIPCRFQFPNGFPYRVDTLLADARQAFEGIIPAIRQGEDDGQQALGFQRQAAVLQVVVGHDGVVPCFFDAEYCHDECLISFEN